MGSFTELSQSGIDFTSLLKRDDDDNEDDELIIDTDIDTNFTVSSRSAGVTTTHGSPPEGVMSAVPVSRLITGTKSIPLDYLSKSLDPVSLLGDNSKVSDITEAYSNEHDTHSAATPLLTTHKSLSHLYHNNKVRQEKHSQLRHRKLQNGGHQVSCVHDVTRRAGGVQRLLSEESATRRINLTRSMENVAQGGPGSLLSIASLDDNYQV